MRKHINGKVYDTDTASFVGEHELGMPGDFNYVCETLYRKRTGEYFVHGEGGANTCYSRQTGTCSWSGGEAIMPMGRDQAREWAESNLSTKDYEAEFWSPGEDEDGGEELAYVLVPVSAKEAVERESRATGETPGQVVARLAAAIGR